MLRVALTGGLCSGKSTVAGFFQSLGAATLDADRIGHTLLQPGGAAETLVIERFGQEIVDAHGAIGRDRLAGIVFSDPRRLAELNAILHPLIGERLEAALQALERQGQPLVIVEASVLIEAGMHTRYDRLIVVTSSPEQKIQRFEARSGASRQQALARLDRQIPDAEKARLADFVIDNSGSRDATHRQVEDLYAQLRAQAAVSQHAPQA